MKQKPDTLCYPQLMKQMPDTIYYPQFKQSNSDNYQKLVEPAADGTLCGIVMGCCNAAGENYTTYGKAALEQNEMLTGIEYQRLVLGLWGGEDETDA